MIFLEIILFERILFERVWFNCKHFQKSFQKSPVGCVRLNPTSQNPEDRRLVAFPPKHWVTV